MSIAVVSSGVTTGVAERRKFPRYRYCVPISIQLPNLEVVRGMTVEISETGMSAVVGAVLPVSATVHLAPVAGSAAEAIIRRGAGRLCGFEFLDLDPELALKIREMCAHLPRYYSETLDVWQWPAAR
jgi:c-di-GMP-binding flagellar brake protein YcgR